VAADSAYGDQDGFRAELSEAGLPFVMALKPRRGVWAYGPDAHTPVDAACALAWGGPDDPGDWQAVTRTFRDGHAETWRAADPATLPDKATWYLATNCPAPAARVRQTAIIRWPTWPRSPGSTASGTGSKSATTGTGQDALVSHGCLSCCDPSPCGSGGAQRARV
jgi:SRSO17 transposase